MDNPAAGDLTIAQTCEMLILSLFLVTDLITVCVFVYMCVVLGNSAVDFFFLALALALGIYFSRQINFQSDFFLSVSNPGFLFKMFMFMFS